MLVFTDVPTIDEQRAEIATGRKRKGKANETKNKVELQLQRANEELQSTREEMQTSQEELKSTNEELQSTIEELQSNNEELTTSKEEIQSMNEELQTLNIELQTKVSDYIQANSDMKNLLNSIEVATLFLDKELKIRRYTDDLVKLFKLRLTDIGRPFTDLVSHLRYPEIENHALKVLKTLTTIETAIATNDNRWYSIRIMPYRTLDDRIDGLVITFSDISVAKKLEMALTAANEELRKSSKKK
jgi:two-component system CheB/CheR fusion protein